MYVCMYVCMYTCVERLSSRVPPFAGFGVLRGCLRGLPSVSVGFACAWSGAGLYASHGRWQAKRLKQDVPKAAQHPGGLYSNCRSSLTGSRMQQVSAAYGLGQSHFCLLLA